MKQVPVAAAALLFLACAAAPGKATTPEPRAKGAVEVLRVPAWSEVLAGGRVVVIETDFLHLAGYDARSGKRVWRRKFQERASGGHSLHLVAGRLLAWAGNKIHVVVPRTGRILRSYDAFFNRSSEHCSLGQAGDTCYFHCQCDFQLFDCASGKRLGPRHRKTHVEFHDMDGSSSGGCYGRGFQIVGRAGDAIVLTLEGKRSASDKSSFAAPIDIVALDAKNGAERWRCRECDTGDYLDFRTVSADGRHCLVGDASGALRLFSCKTGKLELSRPGHGEKKRTFKEQTFIAWVERPPGVFHSVRGRAELLDPETGKTRWTVALEPEEIALPLGADYDQFGYRKQPRAVALLDPATGERRASIRLGSYGVVKHDGRGGVLAVDIPLRAYTPEGKERARHKLERGTGNLHRVAGLYVFRRQDSANLVNRDSLAEVGAVDGVLGVAATDDTAPDGTVLFHVFPPDLKDPGEALLVRAQMPDESGGLERRILEKARGLKPDVLARALAARAKARKRGGGKKDLLTIIDYALPSTEKRLWVVDLARGEVLFHELVAHGKGSGDNRARKFSNQPGSLASSPGLYQTLGTYQGKHGYSLKLKGLDQGVNHNAEERAIVIHGAWYVSEAFARQHGRLGRSWGCPALDKRVARQVIDTIKDGSLLFIHHEP